MSGLFALGGGEAGDAPLPVVQAVGLAGFGRLAAAIAALRWIVAAPEGPGALARTAMEERNGQGGPSVRASGRGRRFVREDLAGTLRPRLKHQFDDACDLIEGDAVEAVELVREADRLE